MANWEFFDNQTPASTIELVDELRAGNDVRPTRGPNKVCTFKQVSRVLAGFHDGLADEGVGAGPASLVGLRLAKEKGWTAPTGESSEASTTPAGSGSGSGATEPSAPGAAGGTTMGRTEVTPASDDAKATKAEPAAIRDEGGDAPSEDETTTRTTGSTTKKKKGS
jgi:NADH-quinone oxidoreductase subunit E